MAVWDVHARARNERLVDAIGGAVRTRVPLWWSFGDQSAEADEAGVRAKVTEGIHSFMFKVGGPVGPQAAVARVAAFARYADDVDALCCVDANAGWTESQAMTFAAGVQPYARHCLFLEQPMPPTAPHEAFARVRKTLGIVLLVADESIVTLADGAALAATGAVGGVSIKCSKSGGVTRTLAIARLADAVGMAVQARALGPRAQPCVHVFSWHECCALISFL
eukprot:m.54280 g.54280  ORF g.54280 m.54280 type:complete len:222 (-) comp16761_c0_seq2:627-1292(-)